MADQSSIWKKEISLGRRKADAPAAEVAQPIWKKEIRLGRRAAPPVAPVEHNEEWTPAKRTEFWAAAPRPAQVSEPSPPALEPPVTEPAVAVTPAPAVTSATAVVTPEPLSRNFAALDPRFRQVAVLAKLVEQRAAEYPARVNEWRQMLPRLAEQAEDGVLPAGLDSVVRTLFYEVLHVGPNAPNGVEQTFNEQAVTEQTIRKPKRSRLKRSAKTVEPAEPTPEPAVKPEGSGLRRELHLPRPKLPKLSRGARTEKPEKPEKAAKPESGLRRELHLPRPKLPKLSRRVPAEKPEKVEKAEKQEKQAGLRRSLRMPQLKMPRIKLSLPRGNGRSSKGTEKLVGLRIGSSQLAAALVHNNGSAELLQLARSPLDSGVIVGGEVRDSEGLARSLRAFFKEHKLPSESVRVGISNNRIGVRMLEVPVIDDPVQFENALRFRMQEVLPIPIAEAVVDHVVLDDKPNADGKLRVLVVFAHKDLVDGYVDACRRAGLKLAGIDLDAFALLRALSEPPTADVATEKRTAVVAVAIGHERTIFAVSDGRICDFTRVLEWGGVWLDTALEKALDLSPEQAAETKHSLSLSPGAPPPAGLSPVQAEAALSALRHEVQVLGRELLSSLQFYQSRPGSLDIGEILLSGGGAQLDGIEGELSRALGVPVRVGDPLGNVTLGKNIVRPAESGSLAIAIGLAIEDQH
jgi:type IV pilus assembly protein PilM